MPRTIRELLDDGAARLDAGGIESPRQAAELFLRAILDLRRIDIHIDPARPVTHEAVQRFEVMINRKLLREPLQYIIGSTEWFGLEFKCDARALIPRPETELIVERALELIRAMPQPRVADVGTGTGCIAIAIAHHRPDASIVASDLSSGALQLAEENVAQHKLEKQIALRYGDLLTPFYLELPFDLIISNPPYVRESELSSLMSEVRDYEPHSALVAGDDGLEVIRQLIIESPDLLAAEGHLVLEFGIDHIVPICKLAEREGRLREIETIVDYNQRDRGIVFRGL
jgi:release factor glutamine methyltransferase